MELGIENVHDVGYCAIASPILTTKNRVQMILQINESWLQKLNIRQEDVLLAGESAFCCNVKRGSESSRGMQPVKCVRDKEPNVIANGFSVEFFFHIRAVCTSSWRHMGAKQVVVCVAVCNRLLFSNPVALLSRITRNENAFRKTYFSLGSPNTQYSVSPDNRLSSGLRFVVYIVQLEPIITTAMGMASISFALFPKPDGFLGQNAQRLYPDPGPHQLMNPVTRWSLCVLSYSTYAGAFKSITKAQEYIQNKAQNIFNMDLEAAGLAKIVAVTSNW